jgi:hypothetical protein
MYVQVAKIFTFDINHNILMMTLVVKKILTILLFYSKDQSSNMFLFPHA